MSLLASTTIFHINRYTHLGVCINKFHTSCIIYLNQYWREKKKLPKNPNQNTQLMNSPDYSYKDKRPVPYGGFQFIRLQKHQNYMEQIVKLVKEVDNAVEKHAKLTKEKEEQKQQILDSKLKPKGQILITDN